MTSVSLPESVISIGDWLTFAFDNCTSLRAITVDERNSVFSSAGGVLFNKDQTTLLKCPEALSGGYRVPDTVTTIGYQAFSNCVQLTAVSLPSRLTTLRDGAFACCRSLTSITLPRSVTNIEQYAFYKCPSLTAVYFGGDCPSPGILAFYGDNQATPYYVPGTPGWGPTYAGHPTALWRPWVRSSGPGFGVRTNGFGFNGSWADGQSIVVEACTNVISPTWWPLRTNTLTGGSVDFSDPDWAIHPTRFYRLRSL